MKLTIPILLSLILVSSALGELTIPPTQFLNTKEPDRMCQSYIDETTDSSLILFGKPSGGAILRVKDGDIIRNVYIFCDEPTHRLILFSAVDSGGYRLIRPVKDYGRQIPDPTYVNSDSSASFTIVPQSRDSIEYFDTPVDIAVSSRDRIFDPDTDKVYVLDQDNKRVVILRYDYALDSLIWISSFGEDDLIMPTSLDYADYGDYDFGNDDIYVADAGSFGIKRFSIAGDLEASFGGWGYGLGNICYPTGIAVSTSEDYPNRIYVTDSHAHRVVRYYSETDGPIMAEWWYVFPLWPWPLINSVDTDIEGNVYVLDSFNHHITVLDPGLNGIITTYGSEGYSAGQFHYPQDLYIDSDEMQVCEMWDQYSGISSHEISWGSPKKATDPLPTKFYLYQNYPNPFNPSTTIMFDLAEPGNVEITIYNILGQRVITLLDQGMGPGNHKVVWDGRNHSGQPVASGLYFYRIQSGDNIATKKLLLLK